MTDKEGGLGGGGHSKPGQVVSFSNRPSLRKRGGGEERNG